jgi:hypothetical protein
MEESAISAIKLLSFKGCEVFSAIGSRSLSVATDSDRAFHFPVLIGFLRQAVSASPENALRS